MSFLKPCSSASSGYAEHSAEQSFRRSSAKPWSQLLCYALRAAWGQHWAQRRGTVTWEGAAQGLSTPGSGFHCSERVQACDCQTGNFILASGKGTQSNTQVLKQLNSRPTPWIKYFYKIEVLWSLRVTDFIAQMHRNGRAIACAAKEGQCTKSSPHWEIIPPRLLTPATGDTQ